MKADKTKSGECGAYRVDLNDVDFQVQPTLLCDTSPRWDLWNSYDMRTVERFEIWMKGNIRHI